MLRRLRAILGGVSLTTVPARGVRRRNIRHDIQGRRRVMGDATSTRQLTAWMADFAASLDRRDVAAAVGMFDDDSYWRDLLPFTWNIKTLEGKGSIATMLEATLHEAKPGNWLIEGNATASDGATGGWLTLETEAARGTGHIRLNVRKCCTLLTTWTDLKG